MTRKFTKPLNQMTNELFKYFWELRSKLDNSSMCECDDTDKVNEAYEIHSTILDAKNNCSDMNLLSERMIKELEKRDDLNEKWKNNDCKTQSS